MILLEAHGSRPTEQLELTWRDDDEHERCPLSERTAQRFLPRPWQEDFAVDVVASLTARERKPQGRGLLGTSLPTDGRRGPRVARLGVKRARVRRRSDEVDLDRQRRGGCRGRGRHCGS